METGTPKILLLKEDKIKTFSHKKNKENCSWQDKQEEEAKRYRIGRNMWCKCQVSNT